MSRATCIREITRRPFRFIYRVLRAFKRNEGMLLASAVAFQMLLSLIPLILLLLVGLSRIVPVEQLLLTVENDLDLLVPTMSERIGANLRHFLDNRDLVGSVGLFALIFFSSMAFRVLEDAMSIIFFHRVTTHHRPALISALLPFLFIILIGFGLLVITFISGALHTLRHEEIQLLGRTWELTSFAEYMLHIVGILGIATLLTAFYLVLPVGPIAVTHAVVGGLVAAVLWEIVRNVLVWYFQTLSIVNVIYGSLAGAVVILLSLDGVALILLLGAQVIAEFERCSDDDDDDVLRLD